MSKVLHHPALIDKRSVQVKYRPVLQAPIPDLPNPARADYDECRDWWEEQYRRCTEGWTIDGVFINPIYYFYLNFVKVFVVDELNEGKEHWINPYFRDGDKEYFDAVWFNRSYVHKGKLMSAKNLIVAKGRRKGWTTSELFGITMWHFLFKQGRNISRAYAVDDVSKKERALFTKCYAEIHPFWKVNEDDEDIDILVDNEGTLSQCTYTLNEKGSKIKKSVVNSIFFWTVSPTATGVRGDYLGLVVVVEAGTHKYLSSLYAAAEEALTLGVWKIGPMLIGGTSDAINNLTTDYGDMFWSPEVFKASRIFTPAWKCFLGCFDYFNGKSKRIEALDFILKERQAFKDGGNYKEYRKKLQEHPISPEEAFIPQGESEYDDASIDNQMMLLLRANMNKTWLRGKLVWERDAYKKKTGKVIFEECPDGLWMVQEQYGVPILDVKNLYVAGIDDVYKDKAPNSKSKNAMIIYMKDSLHVEAECDMPVAFYVGRHSSRTKDYEEFHKGTIFYDCMVMYEHNESAGYIGYCKQKEITHKFIYHKGEIGVRLSEEVKADLTILGLQWFEEGRFQRVLHTELIKCFKFWNSGINSDLCSAMHLVFFALEKTKRLGTINEKREEYEGNATDDDNFKFFHQPVVTLQEYQESEGDFFQWNHVA